MQQNTALQNSLIKSISAQTPPPEEKIIHTISTYFKESTELAVCFEELAGVYYTNGEPYMQRYSAITMCINASQDKQEYLSKTCAELCEAFRLFFAQDPRCKYVVSSLQKLADHVELELLREEIDGKRSEKISKIDKEIKSSIQELDAAKAKLDKAEMGYIGTLGLFSGIVMAFTGVFSISENVLANLGTTPAYKLLLVISLLGFVLFNVVYAIFYCISRFLDRKFLDKCFTTKQENCDNCKKNCNPFFKTIKHHYVFFFANMFFVFMLKVSFIVWLITRFFK